MITGLSRMSARRFLAASVVAGGLLVSAVGVQAADHMDAPALQNPAVTGPQDINDIYAFTSPTQAGSTVMIMTVNPLAGVQSPTIFDPNTLYEFRIDTDGDAIANLVYQFSFRSNPRRPDDQRVMVRVFDSSTPSGTRGVPRNVGVVRGVGQSGRPFPIGRGGRAQVGVFDDPFFFDLAGFENNLMFTGDDFFAGLNVTAIVMELPNADVTRGTPNISVWARTLSGGTTQVDRMGRPAINTVLIPSPQKDAFNAGIPVNDPSAFGPAVVNTLTSPPFNRTSGDAMALAGVLLPDVLTFDVTNTSGFLNGRQLADDVIDAELQLLTANPAATDGVNANDVPFSPTFPYLAPPHP